MEARRNAITFLVAGQQVFLPLISKNFASGGGAWTTIVSTDFEGTWPGPWQLAGGNDPTAGQHFWGKRNCVAFAGSYSGWGVGGGAQGSALGCGANYPDNAISWMVYGPFSLTDASAAELQFKLWSNTEADYDLLAGWLRPTGTPFMALVLRETQADGSTGS